MENYNPLLHNRRSIRLKNFDYTNEALYFITICVQDRKCLFGGIGKIGEMVYDMPERTPTRGAPTLVLNDAGKMVEREWLIMPKRFPQIKLHEYIIMPNHFHGIIEIVRAPLVGAQLTETDSSNSQNKHLGEIIGAFKSWTTNSYISGVKAQNWPRFEKRLWQRNYWEHIIRNEKAYGNISHYIQTNPEKWLEDSLGPGFKKVA